MREKKQVRILHNLEEIRRRDFPQLGKGRVYVDNAATTLMPLSVKIRMDEYENGRILGSSHSESTEAKEATRAFEEAREKLSAFFKATEHEVAFTSGATASSTFVALRFGFKPEDQVIITRAEHNSSVLTPRNAAARAGATVSYADVDRYGRVDLGHLKSLASRAKPKGRTLIYLVHASNVTGAVNNVKRVREEIGDAPFIYLDMAQSAGHFPIALDEMGVDFAGLSAHKMYGPKGIGAVFVSKRRGHVLDDFVSGGGAVVIVTDSTEVYQPERERFEPGTPNIEGAIAWGMTLDYLRGIGMDNVAAHDLFLIDRFMQGLRSMMGRFEIYNYCFEQPRLQEHVAPVGSFNIYEDVRFREMHEKLDGAGISLRSGCFCAHLLLPIILRIDKKWMDDYVEVLQTDPQIARGALRASFAFYNSPEDVDRTLTAIEKVAHMPLKSLKDL